MNNIHLFALRIRKYSAFLLLIATLLGVSCPSIGQEFDTPNLRDLSAGDHTWVDLGEFHPTQAVIGLIAVDMKASKLEKLKEESPEKLNAYFLKNPIPVVIGPDLRLYLIDHHHQLRATVKIGQSHFYIEVVENKSDMSMDKFEKWLIKKNYVYLRDENDQEIKIDDIPDSVLKLKDDPFRSLAGVVEDSGGFTKIRVPFVEFQWARFYRKYFNANEINKNFEASVSRAVDLSHSKEARDLPGYIKIEKACRRAL